MFGNFTKKNPVFIYMCTNFYKRMKVTQVNFNSFSLIKRILSPWVDLNRLNFIKMMHSNMRYLIKQSSWKIIIIKVWQEKFQLEFIEHIIRFMCFTLIITSTEATRDLKPLSYSQQRNRSRVCQMLGQGDTSQTKTTEKIWIHDLTMVQFIDEK